jgi:pimeloyl-ACP methyl ester carboxylesterase
MVSRMTERDLIVGGGRTLHVYDEGDPSGPLVLAHHGTPSAGLLRNSWIEEAAARGLRLVGYDRPGYGGSDRQPGRTVADAADDAGRIADALGASRFLTWGASGGGPHALACAALLPDRVVAAAGIASVAPYDADGLDWSAGMGQDNLDEFGAAIAGPEPLGEFLGAARAGLLAASPEELAHEMRTLLPDVDAAALTGEFGHFMYTSMASSLRSGFEGWLDDDLAFVRGWGFDVESITVPVLIEQGRLDLMVPYPHGDWLAARVPGAEAWLKPEDGHVTLVASLESVLDWLAGHL